MIVWAASSWGSVLVIMHGLYLQSNPVLHISDFRPETMKKNKK